MNIEFYFENNNLCKQDPEITINQYSTDVNFSFTLNEEWKNYKVYCIVKDKEFIYRLELNEVEDKFECKLPDKATIFQFIKLSLYGINDEDRITSNELIIPIIESGYISGENTYPCGDFHHCGRPHHHHDFPYCFYPVNNHHHHHRHRCNNFRHISETHGSHHNCNGGCHIKHPSQWKKHDKSNVYCHSLYHIHNRMFKNLHLGDDLDFFSHLLNDINKEIDSIVVDGDKCYAYHGDTLLEIVTLPNYINRRKLHYFFGELGENIHFFENGDLEIRRDLFGL